MTRHDEKPDKPGEPPQSPHIALPPGVEPPPLAEDGSTETPLATSAEEPSAPLIARPEDELHSWFWIAEDVATGGRSRVRVGHGEVVLVYRHGSLVTVIREEGVHGLNLPGELGFGSSSADLIFLHTRGLAKECAGSVGDLVDFATGRRGALRGTWVVALDMVDAQACAAYLGFDRIRDNLGDAVRAKLERFFDEDVRDSLTHLLRERARNTPLTTLCSGLERPTLTMALARRLNERLATYGAQVEFRHLVVGPADEPTRLLLDDRPEAGAGTHGAALARTPTAGQPALGGGTARVSRSGLPPRRSGGLRTAADFRSLGGGAPRIPSRPGGPHQRSAWAQRWLLRTSRGQEGPLDLKQAVLVAVMDDLDVDRTLVCAAGQDEWKSAAEIPEFVSEFSRAGVQRRPRAAHAPPASTPRSTAPALAPMPSGSFQPDQHRYSYSDGLVILSDLSLEDLYRERQQSPGDSHRVFCDVWGEWRDLDTVPELQGWRSVE